MIDPWNKVAMKGKSEVTHTNPLQQGTTNIFTEKEKKYIEVEIGPGY